MIIKDNIWGEFKINEPIIKELINSKSMQRLKGISQYGMPYKFYPLNGFSRYEHSIGVGLLLRKLSASLEEQAAGFLHDVSHTAFSHVVDWVIGNKNKEDYQDKIHKKIIFDSDIPKILEKYGFEKERIVDYSNYSLLERPAPDLCADRIDYSIREFNCWAAPDAVRICADSLRKNNRKIVFSSKETAKIFALNYLKCQKEHWGGAEWTLRYALFSDMLKNNLDRKIIEIEDFYYDDEYVLNKIGARKDEKTEKILEMLSNKLKFETVINNEDYYLRKKFRYVDPEYLNNDRIFRLSETSNEFLEALEKNRRTNEKGIKIKLISKT